MRTRRRTAEDVLRPPENKPAALTDEQKAIKLVGDHILQTRADVEELEDGDVYLLQFSLNVGAWVAWVGTTIDDGCLYRVLKYDGAASLTVFKETSFIRLPEQAL